MLDDDTTFFITEVSLSDSGLARVAGALADHGGSGLGPQRGWLRSWVTGWTHRLDADPRGLPQTEPIAGVGRLAEAVVDVLLERRPLEQMRRWLSREVVGMLTASGGMGSGGVLSGGTGTAAGGGTGMAARSGKGSGGVPGGGWSGGALSGGRSACGPAGTGRTAATGEAAVPAGVELPVAVPGHAQAAGRGGAQSAASARGHVPRHAQPSRPAQTRQPAQPVQSAPSTQSATSAQSATSIRPASSAQAAAQSAPSAASVRPAHVAHPAHAASAPAAGDANVAHVVGAAGATGVAGAEERRPPRFAARSMIRSVRLHQPASGIVESTVVVQDGPRVRAVALRFEQTNPVAPTPGRPAPRGQSGFNWMCTALQFT